MGQREDIFGIASDFAWSEWGALTINAHCAFDALLQCGHARSPKAAFGAGESSQIREKKCSSR
jgi:hypothetical protein